MEKLTEKLNGMNERNQALESYKTLCERRI